MRSILSKSFRRTIPLIQGTLASRDIKVSNCLYFTTIKKWTWTKCFRFRHEILNPGIRLSCAGTSTNRAADEIHCEIFEKEEL